MCDKRAKVGNRELYYLISETELREIEMPYATNVYHPTKSASERCAVLDGIRCRLARSAEQVLMGLETWHNNAISLIDKRQGCRPELDEGKFLGAKAAHQASIIKMAELRQREEERR